MILLENVGVAYKGTYLWDPSTTVLKGIDATFGDTDHVAIFGDAGSGKTTLLRILSGLMEINAGRIVRTSTVSPPLGFSGASAKMTMAQYMYFVAKCYSVNPKTLREFVLDFFELPDTVLDRVISRLQPDLRSRFNMAIGYGLPFDIYLIDGRYATGDTNFKVRCMEALDLRKKGSGIIFASNDPRHARRFCRTGAVLHNGRLSAITELEEAITLYKNITEKYSVVNEDAHFRPV